MCSFAFKWNSESNRLCSVAGYLLQQFWLTAQMGCCWGLWWEETLLLPLLTHILLDEIHEWNLFSDFLLIALQDSLAKFQSLHLVLMSATVDTQLFTKYFNNCPVFVGSVYVMFIVIHFVCNLCQFYLLFYYCIIFLTCDCIWGILSSSSSSSSLLSPLCMVFTITYLQETMFLGYIVLQLFCIDSLWYTQSNKNPSAWYFVRPAQAVTCGTVVIIIWVVFLSPYLRICGISLSSIHYNQSHRVYIKWKQQYICLIWN